MRYEVASALTRSIVGGTLDPADAEAAWRQIAAMPITLHDLHDGPAVIVLAQKLGAEVWTLDGPLARNAAGSGLPVRLIEVARASG